MDTLSQEFGYSEEQLESIFNIGFEFMEFGEHGAAETIFRGLVELAPHDESFRSFLGVSMRRQGRNEEAERVFDEVLAKRPNSVIALLHRGELRCIRGDRLGIDDLMMAASPPSPLQARARALLAQFGGSGSAPEQ